MSPARAARTPVGIPLAFSLNPPTAPWWPAGYFEPADLYACPTCEATAWGYLSPSCPHCFIPDAAFSHRQPMRRVLRILTTSRIQGSTTPDAGAAAAGHGNPEPHAGGLR